MKKATRFEDKKELYNVMASEPMTSYGMTNTLPLIKRTRVGLEKEFVNKVLDFIGRSLVEVSKILPASYSSLTKKTNYDQETSERILEINSLYTLGINVFGDVKIFNMWMDEPHPALEGATPFSMMDTSFGIRLIADMICRIDHGLIS